MKARHQRREGRRALDLIEESTHLVRTSSMATLATYYIGAAPFVLGLLYFWADMSRSPFASAHVAEAALAMTGLFVWLKFWQALFAARIRARLACEPAPAWTLRSCGRILTTQALIQPFALFALPFSAIVVLARVLPPFVVPLPVIALLVAFPWTCAFFQNVTALAAGEESASKLMRESWKQAWLWPGQNCIALLILFLFSFYVFLNSVVVCASLPGLVKMLFGIESIFTQSPWAFLNTTFFGAMFGLTYLCVDPIVKVFFTLRCFYGRSLKSGEDLKAEFKQFATATPQPAAALVVLFVLAFACPARAADSPPPASPLPSTAPAVTPAVSPPDLDHAIDEVIQQRKYTWRMPREETAADAEKGAITRFIERVSEMVRGWARDAFEWLDEMLKKLFRRERPVSSTGDGTGWIVGLHLLLYVLIAAVVIALVVLVFRFWPGRRRPEPVVSEPIQPAPDVADENVGADQLPEDGWTRLARELLERGEFRLAMRAFYLASLSHLSQRNLISIARFKSNREYERELHRRGHSFPELLSTFGENVSVFERIWYGLHEVNAEGVTRFAANVERMRATG